MRLLRCFFLLVCACPAIAGTKRPLVVWDKNFDGFDETVPLLNLVLSSLGPDSPAFEIRKSQPGLQLLRAANALQHGRGIDLISVGTSPELERSLYPIRVPTGKGTLGYRVCLIRKDRAERFRKIRSLDDLKRITIGQSEHWPDTAILRAAGFKVETTARYENLFVMLEKGRFDCFLRAIGEVAFELQQHPDKGFMIEESILIRYDLANFFFVRRGDRSLIEALEKGFRNIEADGRFDRFFREFFQPRFRDLNLSSRQLFEVPVSDQTAETKRLFTDGRLIFHP